MERQPPRLHWLAELIPADFSRSWTLSLATCTVGFEPRVCFQSLRMGTFLPLGHNYNAGDETLFKSCLSPKEHEMQAVDFVIWNSSLVSFLHRCMQRHVDLHSLMKQALMRQMVSLKSHLY